MEENLDVLAGGVEYFDDVGLAQQLIQRRQVQPVAMQRVDDHGLLRAGQLDQAEFRPIAVVAHEFGIDGEEFLFPQAAAQGAQLGIVRDHGDGCAVALAAGGARELRCRRLQSRGMVLSAGRLAVLLQA